MRYALAIVLAALVAAVVAGQEADIPSANFTFDFAGTRWSAPLEQPQRLAVIAGINNTVQSLQADALKLGAILLQSMLRNQTEVLPKPVHLHWCPVLWPEQGESAARTWLLWLYFFSLSASWHFTPALMQVPCTFTIVTSKS